MLDGIKYYLTHAESGLVQMIDFWTFIHEIPNRHGEYDYDPYVYDVAYNMYITEMNGGINE